MLKLFVAKLLAENGLSCDCCVKISSVEADVYARDEAHARELIKKFDPYATVQIQSLEDKGAVEQVRNPGVIVVNSAEVYNGYYENSPLHTT